MHTIIYLFSNFIVSSIYITYVPLTSCLSGKIKILQRSYLIKQEKNDITSCYIDLVEKEIRYPFLPARFPTVETILYIKNKFFKDSSLLI